MASKDLVIEHLETDFFIWCHYEYERIAKFISKYNSNLHITNFTNDFYGPNVVCHQEECRHKFPIDRVCLLDSEASETLSPQDAHKFDYFLLGGILGNVDEFDFDRTSVLREQGYSRRNLGQLQMTTDTAAMVTSLIVHQGIPFDRLKFIDRPEIPINEGDEHSKELLVMNFRYLALENEKPDIDPRILSLAIQDRDFNLSHLE